jgi:hypothetical protein
VYERGDRSVTAVVTMGRGVAVPGRAGAWTVFSSPTLQSLQVLEVSFATAATDVRLYVAPATAAAPLWAVRGVSPPDVLLFDPILYHADLGIGSDVVEDANAAWIADELAGQIFHTAGGDQRITGNSGARLAMASPVSCAPCAFDIILDVGARYGQGSQLRIASPSLSFEPSVPLESGEWRFRVSGGRDLLGFAHTDGIRDGDELVGAPDDTNEFTLSIP